MERNRQFQRKVVGRLTKAAFCNSQISILFAYSYAALEIFRFARAMGWKTVLGQIDAGPAGESITGRLYQHDGRQQQTWASAPTEYWDLWREEVELADCIVANSSWSRRALTEEGVRADKIHVIPLAYDPPLETVGFERTYPREFTSARPLRVLFLGQINLLKGVGEILEAVDLLQNRPVEFWFVGPMQIATSKGLLGLPNRQNTRWVGNVPRHAVSDFYRHADVFLFPSHSDGFGITQLEAQAWKLPLVASQNCGDVVVEGKNGHLLTEVTGENIASLLGLFLDQPDRLTQLSSKAVGSDQFGLDQLGERLSIMRPL